VEAIGEPIRENRTIRDVIRMVIPGTSIRVKVQKKDGSTTMKDLTLGEVGQ
jgi:hypothetical protein